MNTTGFNHQAQCVTFKLEDNLIGINILEIREIVPCRQMTRISNSPDFVLGLMNLRGQILTILDIGVLLGIGKRPASKSSHIIIFKHRDVGFIVDRIGDVVGIEKENIEEIPANIEPAVQAYMEVVVNLPDGILMLLDAQKILSKTMMITSGASGAEES